VVWFTSVIGLVDRLVDLARREDPTLAAALDGVAEAEVAEVEVRCGVRLPATYREFLRTMGRSSGRFVWERGYDHGFATITRRLPTDAYPARYFKIAQTTDDHVADDGTAVDYFLDLEHGDGVDAPLVTFEDPTLRDPDADPDYPGLHPAGHFASRFTRSWFRCVVLERQRCGETVEIASSSDRVVAVLKELGFVEVLPPLPDTRCLRRGAEDGALVMDRVGVVMEIMSRERDVFDRLPVARTLAHGVRRPRNSRS